LLCCAYREVDEDVLDLMSIVYRGEENSQGYGGIGDMETVGPWW